MGKEGGAANIYRKDGEVGKGKEDIRIEKFFLVMYLRTLVFLFGAVIESRSRYPP